MKRRWLLPLLLLSGLMAVAQEKQLDFATYLSGVGQHNLGYAAEKFNMDIAAANVLMAKVFPDPEINAGLFDNGQRRMQQGYGLTTGISYTLELGGKRRARINLARSEQEVTRHLLEDYFRNLRADATVAFLTAMQQQRLYEIKMEAYRYMQQLAQADSIRFKAGLITETDARQSRIEAGMLLNEAYGVEAEMKTAFVQLHNLMGTYRGDTLVAPQGDVSRFERVYSLPELVTKAQDERADLLAALRQKDVSVKTLQLAKAARIIDLGLNLGVNNATQVTNVVAPTPSMNTVSAGISLPLKFSNRNKGDLMAANAGVKQQETVYRQTLLQVQTEVTTAYFSYLGAGHQLHQFDSGLLEEAKKVLEGRRYSYQRGETSLLEVLNAQRTYNDVQQQYYESVYSHATALVELERAAAIWDIQF
ncbi:TolC family protein [Chitinophaga flava]|uniref:TolC family protein n=1 Tax=Chitinophaga flava TaxID=2259036 RepID=A0A365XSR1_9BACT|nr:TolC family protein [Chitinophaga flava]RBL89389.1 TolC family protein [Chitinophaga flava]